MMQVVLRYEQEEGAVLYARQVLYPNHTFLLPLPSFDPLQVGCSKGSSPSHPNHPITAPAAPPALDMDRSAPARITIRSRCDEHREARLKEGCAPGPSRLAPS